MNLNKIVEYLFALDSSFILFSAFHSSICLSLSVNSIAKLNSSFVFSFSSFV